MGAFEVPINQRCSGLLHLLARRLPCPDDSFITKQGTEIPIDYRMLRRGDRWLAYDVIIEGVSLVANYRVQFDKIIRTASYAELVTRMKNKGGFSTSGEARQKEQTPRS
jgi:hypothetical protein